MIKIFTTNQNGKIEFTKQELLEFIEEIKQEYENHRIDPVKPSIHSSHPAHPTWNTSLYRDVKPSNPADDIGFDKNSGIFNELLKELGCR